MARLLLNLRHVPDDELEEIRTLLDEHHIDYYETAPNRWGISMGAIWLKDEDQYPQARTLLTRYEHERRQRMRAAHEAERARGEAETLWQRICRRPVETLIYVAVAALVLYLSTKPFLDLAGD